MVVPPTNPKMIIFSRKKPWLLGKPTILGNPHIGAIMTNFHCWMALWIPLSGPKKHGRMDASPQHLLETNRPNYAPERWCCFQWFVKTIYIYIWLKQCSKLKAQTLKAQTLEETMRCLVLVFLCLALVGAAPKKPGKPVPPRAGGSGIANPESADGSANERSSSAPSTPSLVDRMVEDMMGVNASPVAGASPPFVCTTAVTTPASANNETVPPAASASPPFVRTMAVTTPAPGSPNLDLFSDNETVPPAASASPPFVCATAVTAPAPGSTNSWLVQWQRNGACQLLPTTKQCLLQPACLPLPQPALAQLPSQWHTVNLLRISQSRRILRNFSMRSLCRRLRANLLVLLLLKWHQTVLQ